jgi:membrane-bound lytic murein transglycosylase F
LRAIPIIAASTLLATCASPPSLLEHIRGAGELRVVTRNTPTTFYWGGDEPRGIEYDLARGFADYLGVDLKLYVADQFWQILPDVAQRKAHIGAAGLSVAEPRRQLVEFGPGYETIEQQVVYRRGTPRPRDIEDLLGGRLEVVAGSSYVAVLERAREDVPLLSWIENPNVDAEELIRRVAEGEIDYTVVDSNLFRLLRQTHPEAGVAFSLGTAAQLAWALPEGEQDLRELIAAYFAEIEATGRLEQILDRYYFASRDFDYVGSRAFVRHFSTRLPRYRVYFREAELETGIDWRLLAALAYQESHWNLDAVSPTGVRGIMMLTEHTAEMMNVRDRADPRESILGGARYLRRLIGTIPERIPEPDRTWLAVAAYNIGFGHLEDARIITQIQGGDPDRWEEVRERLPLLSDERWYSRVARGYARGSVPVIYVDNVQRYHELLLWMTSNDGNTRIDPTLSASLRPGR